MDKTERRAQLLSRARDVFAKRGYHAAKIEDIVAAAKVALGIVAEGDTRVFAYLTVGAIKELLYQSVMHDLDDESADRLTSEVFSFLCRGCLRIPDEPAQLAGPRLEARSRRAP